MSSCRIVLRFRDSFCRFYDTPTEHQVSITHSNIQICPRFSKARDPKLINISCSTISSFDSLTSRLESSMIFGLQLHVSMTHWDCLLHGAISMITVWIQPLKFNLCKLSVWCFVGQHYHEHCRVIDFSFTVHVAITPLLITYHTLRTTTAG